jgi:hypothetical protein
MNSPQLSSARPRAFFASACIVTLVVSAVIYQGYNVRIGLDPDDSENLETTRVLAAAHQFGHGLAGLYGPYSGENPWVLIQAPLYYRLTGLLAWPLWRSGFTADTACLVAGRAISAFALIGCLALVLSLSQIDGASRRAGWLAAMIVASSPVVASFPVAMRPDMFGVFFQTLGVALVLRTLWDGSQTRSWQLSVAYAAFGIAICTKQHFLGGAVVSSVLLGVALVRGQQKAFPIALAHGVGLATVISYYGAEEILTGGMMSKSVFVLPSSIQNVTGGSWLGVLGVFLEVGKRSLGLSSLLIACFLVIGRRGMFRKLDAVLLPFILLDLALMVKLCLNSAGGWYNYALQPVVFAAIIGGRWLDRALDQPVPRWKKALVGVSAVVVMVSVTRNVVASSMARRDHNVALMTLLDDPHIRSRPSSERYFAGGLQHCNRRFGQMRLTHDEWLYRAFEAISAVNPRSNWLRAALTTGPVHQVVVPWDDPYVPGVPDSLPLLGYRPIDRFGRYQVWDRR